MVEGPPEVPAELARIGAELVARYPGDRGTAARAGRRDPVKTRASPREYALAA